MKFCSDCGDKVTLEIPQGDNVLRHVCKACGMIHYQNPNMVTGCLVEHDGKVLLCKRAIEPRYGLWTLPAGFMENGETTMQAAQRETREEACAEVDLIQLFTMFSLPHINQVYLLYRASLKTPEFSAGPESLEVELYDEADIPWEQIAFPVIAESLKLFFRDRKDGHFNTWSGAMSRQDSEPPSFEVSLLGEDD